MLYSLFIQMFIKILLLRGYIYSLTLGDFEAQDSSMQGIWQGFTVEIMYTEI